MPTLPALDTSLNVNNSPHVVILGAGASVAAFPKGDRNGLRLPVMKNFAEVLGLQPLLDEAGFVQGQENFEDLYDDLSRNPSMDDFRNKLEIRIHEYFSAMQLPDQVTLYDELVLTLRSKDIIATFNWDPLLLQAWKRNAHVGDLPNIVFLHGNVAVGYCESDRVKGNIGRKCLTCERLLTPSPLLYPIKDKNYRDNPFLSSEWALLEAHLEHAFLLTVFGYSAPVSDVNARDLLKKAWDSNTTRELAEVEIVDIRPRRELINSWKDFFVRSHFAIHRYVSRSLAYRHPRRSCDAFAGAILQNDPWSVHRLTRRYKSLTSLQVAVAPLVTEEIMLQETNRPFSKGCPLGRRN
jgi:hypothetical protein